MCARDINALQFDEIQPDLSNRIWLSGNVISEMIDNTHQRCDDAWKKKNTTHSQTYVGRWTVGRTARKDNIIRCERMKDVSVHMPHVSLHWSRIRTCVWSSMRHSVNILVACAARRTLKWKKWLIPDLGPCFPCTCDDYRFQYAKNLSRIHSCAQWETERQGERENERKWKEVCVCVWYVWGTEGERESEKNEKIKFKYWWKSTVWKKNRSLYLLHASFRRSCLVICGACTSVQS